MAPPDAAPDAATGPGARRRVLVADDEADHRWLVRLALEDSDDFAVVAEVGDGDAAVASARAEQPDVVLLDVDMPGRGGLQALPDVRRAAPGATVLLMTAYADEPGLAARAAAHGARLLDKTRGDVLDLTDRLRTELAASHRER